MQLAASRPATRVDRIDHQGLRRLVRAAALSCARHVRLRSLVAIVERRGHARMASWGTSEVSRLEVGIAEARAFQALMRGEVEASDPRVITIAFPIDGGSLRGLVRFESTDQVDERQRAALGIEALRLAATIDAADALSVGDCALRPDHPAAALLGDDGAVLSSNYLFDALAPGADLLDELGTTLRDRDALRRLLDASIVSGGRARTMTLRIGPSARRVVVRCASPLEHHALVIIIDVAERERATMTTPHRATRLPSVIFDRANASVIDGNEAGIKQFESVLSQLAPRGRLALLGAMVETDPEPSWIGPLPLLDGTSAEFAMVAVEHHGIPAIAALAGQ